MFPLHKFHQVIVDTGVLEEFFLLKVKKKSNLSLDETDFLEGLFNQAIPWITPHVLAEFSNRLKSKGIKDDYFVQMLQSFHEEWKKIQESYVQKDSILQFGALKLGITDTSLALLAEQKEIVLLSYDFPLVNWCRKNNISAFHIHELVYN